MRELRLPLALAALLALGGLVVVEVLRPTVPLTRAEQAERIAGELRCPDCQALSVAESDSAAAAAFRREIGDLLAAGNTPDQVRRHFVDRYGAWILLTPPNPLVFWIPAGGIVAGTGLLAWWLWRGRGQRGGPAGDGPPTSNEAERSRVRDEIERLDA